MRVPPPLRCAWAAGLVLGLSACASPGHVAPPAVLLDAATLDPGRAIAQAATLAAPTNTAWWHVFNDAQLNRLLAQSMGSAPSLASARARIERAQAEAGVARANTLPGVSAMSQLLRSQDSEHYKTSDAEAGLWHTDGQALLQASYHLDLWGLDRALNEAALGNLRASQADIAVAQLALSGALVDTWFALAGIVEQQAVVADTLEQRRAILALSQGRWHSGLGTQVDVVRARAPIPLLEAEQARLGGEASRLQVRLATLAGKGPGWGEQWQPHPTELQQPLTLPSHLPADLIGRRPDVQAQRWRVEAQARRVGAARAAFYPNVDLLAYAGFQSFSFASLLHHDSRAYGAGPAITLPIFDAGRLRSQYQAQAADYQQAVATYNQTVVNALGEVAGRVSQLQALASQRERTAQGLEAARQTLELENLRYRQSLTDFLHVLDAQTQVLDTRLQLARVKTAALQQYAGLLDALGGNAQACVFPLVSQRTTSHD
ncbi:efflux transporter outer membrane subunit [Pseudomonas putida]